ncbi:DUF5694 domain-containing protein [uncultured Microbulbifer sp.]|uniref:DUF5694 domain-containing protein n=1 Tax=uncultured Microbulbifer sp. TaxID=348147 RepID=UPI002608D523|nr:DUF5694 domain-containing protein [uncultured Microbulbifer sp.]
MKIVTRILIGALMLPASITGWSAEGQALEVEEAPAAQVMLFGVFHFANPSRDVVKSEIIDVLTPQNQQYLEQLTGKLAKQSPTHVMLECDPTLQEEYDRLFHSYINGEHKLDVNENQQLGFRIAAQAGLTGVICYDEQKVHWNGAKLIEYMKKSNPDRKKLFDEHIQQFSELTAHQHQTFSLERLLRKSNDPSEDRENMNLYLMVNDIGAGGEFVGAEASTSWWHRNFRMYANIQAVAQPGSRVIAIAGSGHTAILKTLLATDLARESWDVNAHL